MFYSLFSPPRSSATLKNARIAAEEDLRFIARCLLNVCIALEEYPLVRYYLPPHHKPLGPFAPPPESQAPPDVSSRWRTTLARGDAGRAESEANSAYPTKLLAYMVQQELDDYKKATPDFPVFRFIILFTIFLPLMLSSDLMLGDPEVFYSLRIAHWTPWHRYCMNSLIKPCVTIFCQ